ncbi:MAG: hypothetical protein IJE49_11805 [Agathobacter sp.]|nr:hypothetical protein [Agathobacter sp.]
MIDTKEKRKLSSSESTRISLEAVRLGEAGLNKHRQELLNRVPKQNDWVALERESVTVKDVAYLSAATHDEFALLRGKTRDILFHGVSEHCYFDEELILLLKTKKLRLVVHSHADYNIIDPSFDDREFLRYIEQKESLIDSYITGKVRAFKADMFDEI